MFTRLHLFVRASLVSGLLIVLGSVSGCASDAEMAAADGEQGDTSALPQESNPASSSGVLIDSRGDASPIAEALGDTSSPLSQRVFYFGFDSSSLNQR